jgi:hypothetical protein
MPHQLAPLPQCVPNGVPNVLPPRFTTLDLAQPGPRRGLCSLGGLLLCSLGSLLLLRGLLPGSSIGGSPGGLLLRSLGGFLPRGSEGSPLILAAGLLLRLAVVPAGYPLILATVQLLRLAVPAGLLLIPVAELLLRLPGISVGLLLILPAGLSPCRRIPAELPPVIPVRGTTDILQSCFVAGDVSQLSLVTVASPARIRPMPNDDAMGPSGGGLGPERTPRVGSIRGNCR